MRPTAPKSSMAQALGLASFLILGILGCQQFTGQGDSKAGDQASEGDLPEDLALKLTIKETDECNALRAEVTASRNDSDAYAGLRAEFAEKCIEEVKPGTRPIPVPPGLLPDSASRCHWIATRIDSGHNEMIIKYKYYCPEACDTLAGHDSVRHVQLCREPNKPDCAELKAKIARLDTNSEEYPRLRRLIGEVCRVRDTMVRDTSVRDTAFPPKDTGWVPPPRPLCDSLKKQLSMVKDTNSEEFSRLRRLIRGKCVSDSLRPPKDTLVAPIPRTCDQLRAKLDPDSSYAAHAKALFLERCVDSMAVPAPLPEICVELKAKLSVADSSSGDYSRLKAAYREKCLHRD